MKDISYVLKLNTHWHLAKVWSAIFLSVLEQLLFFKVFLSLFSLSNFSLNLLVYLINY